MLTSRSIFVAAALVLTAFAVSLLAGARDHSALIPAPPAIYAVAGTRPLTLVTGHTDSRYPVCPGARVRTGSIVAGDFVSASVYNGCVERLTLLSPPVCTASGAGSYEAGLWLGDNPTAHSVLFRSTGPQAAIVAARWCSTPAIVSPGGAALSLVQIPSLTPVRVVSSAGGWVTEVVVERPSLPPAPTALDSR